MAAGTIFLLEDYLTADALGQAACVANISDKNTQVVDVPYDNSTPTLFSPQYRDPATVHEVARGYFVNLYGEDSPVVVSWLDQLSAAVELLDTYLNDTSYPNPRVVCGMGRGARVANGWLRARGPATSLSPNDLSFLLLADPENEISGSIRFARGVFPENRGPYLHSNIGIPDTNAFAVTELISQYEGSADWPNLPDPDPVAQKNALFGKDRLRHMYYKITPDTDDVVTAVRGNVTYVLAPSAPLPLAMAQGQSPQEQWDLDQQLRIQVEMSYSRSMYTPALTYPQFAYPTIDRNRYNYA